MSNVKFCPMCGASMEGQENICPLCGAIIDETQNAHNQNSFAPQPDMFSQQNQPGNQNPDPGFPNQYNPVPPVPPVPPVQFGQVPPPPLQYENYNQYQKNDGAYNGCAITGMIIGILSIFMCCTSFFDIILGIAGVALSAVGLKSYKYKGCAIAGIICSIAGLLFALLMSVTVLSE